MMNPDVDDYINRSRRGRGDAALRRPSSMRPDRGDQVGQALLRPRRRNSRSCGDETSALMFFTGRFSTTRPSLRAQTELRSTLRSSSPPSTSHSLRHRGRLRHEAIASSPARVGPPRARAGRGAAQRLDDDPDCGPFDTHPRSAAGVQPTSRCEAGTTEWRESTSTRRGSSPQVSDRSTDDLRHSGGLSATTTSVSIVRSDVMVSRNVNVWPRSSGSATSISIT